MSQPEPFQEPFLRITVEEAKRLMDNGTVTVVDVREHWEHANDHIPNSTLVPLARILSRPQEAIQNDHVIFYCEVGQRSAVAAEIAASLGFKNIYNMEGGMTAWRKKGLPVEKE
ncbi:MAG: rhodanese-like domain-containing protein [Chloroflexi bacterium]|nr:rhodanese-like domain-containing protein [Chloroflexota bacterium]